MYSTAFWCLFVVLLIFLALLRNHCYSFHRTKWRLVTSICRGPGPVATRMPFSFAEIQVRCKFLSSGRIRTVNCCKLLSLKFEQKQEEGTAAMR